MEHITLEQMLKECVDCILNHTEAPAYFYKTTTPEGDDDFDRIEQVDILDSRFRTSNNDFSEYEWELESSNIYKLTNMENLFQQLVNTEEM